MNIIRKQLLTKYGAPFNHGASSQEIKKEIKNIFNELAPELNYKIEISTRCYREYLKIAIYNNNLYKSYFDFESIKIDNHFITRTDLNSWDNLHAVKTYYYRINQHFSFDIVRDLLKDKYNFILNMVYNKAVRSGIFANHQIKITIEPIPANWGGFNPNFYHPAINKRVNKLIYFLTHKNDKTYHITGREYNRQRESLALRDKLRKITPLHVEDVKIICRVKFPALNKNNTVSENNYEISRKYYESPAIINKIIILSDSDYNLFKNHLLTDYNFINGGGVDDAGFVQCIQINDLIIDPEGYNYARYVGAKLC